MGHWEVINDCRPKLQQTLIKSSIFSHAYTEHRTVIVPAGKVTTEGFLKNQWGCSSKLTLYGLL